MKKESNILVADIGNSRVSFALYIEDDLRSIFHINTKDFFTDDLEKTDIIHSIQDKLYYPGGDTEIKPDRLVVSSVNPRINDDLSEIVTKCFDLKPQFLAWDSKTNLDLMVESPQTLGTDRIVNAVAARDQFANTNLIVVDIGTAVTVDFISNEGAFQGGVITSGPEISLKALMVNCPHLPEIKIEKPASLLGHHTTEAIQSGIYNGFLAMMKGLVANYIETYSPKQNVTVLVTGGMSTVFADDFNEDFVIDPNLTLKGVKVMSDLN